ncbi:coiled-coil domain-containing protein 43-like [Teleopsis dalmanni]|uniref:coiled-coil domain-containing protein 43-like n=1 Tax=Teleopsis dalmanni TaxID=139649 RepID=UPI0018CD12F0|nr:coiled-coil domain-containing protein 43-like [Teleopsis dalmanni]
MTDKRALFKNWLLEKLVEWKTDESVFGNYILGILEGDDTDEEKKDALTDFLSVLVDNTNCLVKMIFEKWKELMTEDNATDKHPASSSIDVTDQLTKLLEAQKIQTVSKERQYTEEERQIRKHILTQYSETPVTDDESSDKPEEATKNITPKTLTGVERNTNLHDVIKLQKERREQARLDSAAKKRKDKEDREKQKQQREEKKEKRKTVKGEHRR